jgi:hypothetical protein
MSSDDHHQSHPDPSIAYHFEWEFRREAALWMSDLAFGVNFHPLATEFRRWLLREGPFSVFAEEHKGTLRSLTNPYSYHASVIAAILAKSINASHAFATVSEPLDDMEADMERIRIYNEQVLYTARFCEATIKQLLYCTQIPESYYKKAPLGILFSAKCSECQRSGRPPHKISMLCSLAHRYGLCAAFDQCLIEHLKIINRRRNIEAAHAEAQSLRLRPSAESRAQLAQDSVEIGNELVHMLEHVADLENRMMQELKSRIGVFHLARARAAGRSELQR